MRTITVLIADDHTIVRQGLKHLLETAPDIQVVGEAGTGDAAVRESKKLQPNVVLMDIAMPVKNGVEAAKQIARQVPAPRILMLSTYHGDAEIQAAIEAGVVGYIMKENASAELLAAVREVSKGNSFFSPQIARRMVRRTQDAFRWQSSAASPLTRTLTARELDVLKLIVQGKQNKMTAADLGISIKTVEKHRQSLMDKLNIHETASLTRYALGNGIVPHVGPVLVERADADQISPNAPLPI